MAHMEVVIANFMESCSSGFASLLKRYEDFVVREPAMATRIESVLKVTSYLIPGVN